MKRRRGISVLEIVVAVLLMGMLLGLCIKMMAWSVRERLGGERRAAALIEANNVMDQITRMPWESLTDENLQQLQLSTEAQGFLPQSKLEVGLQITTSKLESKQITVKIEWPGSRGQREGSVLLNAWKFQEGVVDDPS